jgi:hypothetical protein
MSSFSRRIVCALSTVIVATALATGTTAAAAAPSTQGLEDPGTFEIPTIGECRNYGLGVVAQQSDTTAPLPSCGTTHTSKVIATPVLSESTWAAGASAIHLAMVKACRPAYIAILGRTEKLRQKSAYEIAWYEPTQAQKDAGARWLRCDLILYGGYSLQPITRNAAPILEAYPLPNRVTSCLVGGDPIRLTVCSKTHRYRATGTYLVQRTYYPGTDTLYAIAQRECPSRVTTPRYWYAFWMDRNAWKAGDRTITCYSHTSS